MRKKIEESEKASSHWESNLGHLWLEPPVLDLPLNHNSWQSLTILYMYY